MSDTSLIAVKPLLLLILDGWGQREAAADNAITTASTPNWDKLCQQGSRTQLNTSGAAVGLPEGQMGNSEVGHMNIGAGRVVHQDLVRISTALDDVAVKNSVSQDQTSWRSNLQDVIQDCAADNNTLHIMGLLSPGGVHSHAQHILQLLQLSRSLGARQICVHAFLDGRDTPPRSALESLQQLQAQLDTMDNARLASVCGRFYSMDRDNRWERIQTAWQAIVDADAKYSADTGVEALQAAYQRDENDEFVSPTLISDPAGGGPGIVDGDAVLFANFRADRARQLAQALAQPDFSEFEMHNRPELRRLVTLTNYSDDIPALVLFTPQHLPDVLGQVLSTAGLRQLRIAETEKYAHVTFFLNGGQEQAFAGEQRTLVPSPKVRTYDLQPEMSAPELTAELLRVIGEQSIDVIICNVANADMVGHSGNFAAAVKAVEAVDELLGKVAAALQQHGGEMLITADHGNIEQMQNPDNGQQHTAHTTNPVPLVYFGPRELQLQSGALCDIAPTLLEMLAIAQPAAMTGHSLLTRSEHQP